MNERWAVVRIGGKTRYMVFRHDGIPEFMDKGNFVNGLEAAYYEYKTKKGDITIWVRLRWSGLVGPNVESIVATASSQHRKAIHSPHLKASSMPTVGRPWSPSQEAGNVYWRTYTATYAAAILSAFVG